MQNAKKIISKGDRYFYFNHLSKNSTNLIKLSSNFCKKKKQNETKNKLEML